MFKYFFEDNYNNYIITERDESPVKQQEEEPKNSEEYSSKETEELEKQVQNQAENKNLVPEIVDEIEKQYSEKFKSVPNIVKDRFDTLNKELKNIESTSEYVIAIENLKDTIVLSCDGSRNARREILKTILTSDKFKSEEKRLRDNDTFKKLELSVFRDTNAYKLIQNAIDHVFETIETSVDFDKLKLKDGEKRLESLKEEVKVKCFYGITKEDTTEKYIGDDFSKYIDEISGKEGKDSKPKRGDPDKSIKESDVTATVEPKLLKSLISRCWEKLNDVDKTVLHYFQSDGGGYKDYVASNGLPMKGTTSLMTSEGIVCLCGLAANKFLPQPDEQDFEEENEEDSDNVILELQKIVYKGGNSNAIIHYGQPDSKRRDSQFFELRVSPGVKLKSEKGRCSLVIRTKKSEDDDKLVTKHGKLTSVLDTLKQLLGSEGKRGRSRGYDYDW